MYRTDNSTALTLNLYKPKDLVNIKSINIYINFNALT